LSARLGGVISQTQQINVLGELAYNHWFENILGWQNRLISTQRWGVSFKSFQPMKSFKSKDPNAPLLELTLSTFDLKYRFTPGVWGIDESWGLVFGQESVKLNEYQASLYGGGFFWARSMPRVFDNLFNYIPFFRYPKWVDLDFLYYPNSSSKKIRADQNFSLNFHGKIFWTKRFFGEGGFGYKLFKYTDIEAAQQPVFRSFYGTIGLGVNF
jgi:hypothetical protein